MIAEHNISNLVWKSFVDNHPNGNIFQTPEMYEVYKNTVNNEPVFLAVTENNEVLGVLLGVIQKEISGLFGVFTSRCIVTGGPLIKDNNPEVLALLLEEFTTVLKNKTIFSQFRNLWEWNSLISVFKDHGFKYDPHLDILINIDRPENEIWDSLHSKARNKIRLAEKAGLKFEIIEPNKVNISIIYEILKEVYGKAKIPLADISLFEKAVDMLGPNNHIKIFGALKDKKIIGFRLGLLYKDLIYDWYAGSFSSYYNEHPNDFLPFKTMAWGQKNGYRVFDFGGAGKPNQPYGVRDHKMKFGGELLEFGRFEKIHKPILMEIAKFGLQIYKKVK